MNATAVAPTAVSTTVTSKHANTTATSKHVNTTTPVEHDRAYLPTVCRISAIVLLEGMHAMPTHIARLGEVVGVLFEKVSLGVGGVAPTLIYPGHSA